MIAIDASRFTPATSNDSIGSSSAGSWNPPWGDLFARDTYLTEFLGRLWARFGVPTGDNGKGFEYDLRDRVTGQVVQAYAGSSGPSFGNAAGKRDEVIDALEALLNATAPVDCETTVDHGASQIGIRNGEHFYDFQGDPDSGDDYAD